MSDNTDTFKIDYDVLGELKERIRNYQLRIGDVQRLKDDMVVELSKKAPLNGSSARDFNVKNLSVEEGARIKGDATLDNNLRVKGTLTVDGDVIAKDTDHMSGNVLLGDEDGDAVTVHGTLKSAHTSGSLEIDDALHVAEKLEVGGSVNANGDITATGAVEAGSFSGPGAGLTGLNADHVSDGVLAPDHIPGLNADKIIDGKISIDRIPIDPDINMGESDAAVPTQKAVKAYVDANSIRIDSASGIIVKDGIITAPNIPSTNPLVHRMYPANPKVHQNIFTAKNEGAIAKLGSPDYNEASYTENKPWNHHPIIAYGGNNESDGNGAKVIIPDGFDTVWVRVLGDRWNVIHAYFLDGGHEDLGNWAGGFRAFNCCCPDGSLSDGSTKTNDVHTFHHQWLPIPAGRSGELALISKKHTNNSSFWISGLAFSRNPWAHAAQSAVGYYWAVNGGDKTTWAGGWEKWKGDVLSGITHGTKLELKVPVVHSGRDKLLYIIEHDNNWNGCMHTGVTVENIEIERFISTYDNPFARHWNSKRYARYIAARIPSRLMQPDARHLSVHIDMTKQNLHIHFREIGTHDLDPPSPTG